MRPSFKAAFLGGWWLAPIQVVLIDCLPYRYQIWGFKSLLWLLPARTQNLLFNFFCPHFVLTVQCLDISVQKILDLQVGIDDQTFKGISCLAKWESGFGCSALWYWKLAEGLVGCFYSTLILY